MRALLIGSILVLTACPHGTQPAPTPTPTPTPTPMAADPTRCEVVGQILAAAGDDFASLRGERQPGSVDDAQGWASTVAMPGATEVDVTLVQGTARWTATFSDDDVRFETLHDELAACDTVAALMPDDPVDDDDDGAVDVMGWMGQDGTTLELTRGPGGSWLMISAHH